MRKIILVILSTILFASNQNTVVFKEKEKKENNTTIKEELFLRRWITDRINAVLPSYLQTEPTENMVNFSMGYDFRSNKFYNRLKLKLVFPAIEGKYSKSTLTKTKTIKIKLIPIFQVYKQLPCLTLKGSFTFSNDEIIKNFTFNESIYYYTTYTEYKEITTFTFRRFVTIDNLMFKVSKTYYSTQKTNMFYVFGFYYYSDFYKFIRIYGIEWGGERKKDPFIYWYKLFFTYRHILFDRRYIFLEFTPYLLISKEYHFSPKTFASISFNIKF
jgi:hypothetical protein